MALLSIFRPCTIFHPRLRVSFHSFTHPGDSATLAIGEAFFPHFLNYPLLICFEVNLLHLLEAACCFLFDDFTSEVCTKMLLHFPADHDQVSLLIMIKMIMRMHKSLRTMGSNTSLNTRYRCSSIRTYLLIWFVQINVR